MAILTENSKILKKMANKKKWIFGIIGTILLSAVGSAVWEYIIRPTVNISSNFVLNVVSFGVENFKTQIYIEIAKNFHEGISLDIWIFIIASMLAFLTFSVYKSLVGYFRRNEGIRSNNINKRYKIIIFIAIIELSMIAFIGLKAAYINKAVTNYNQLLSIASPYMLEEDRILIESKFAQIKSEADYETIMKYLIEIAKDNNIDNPTRSY